MLIDRNARSHNADIVHEYLNEAEISHIIWPTRNFGLNNIEKIWDLHGENLQLPAPANLELSAVVAQEL